MSLLNPAYTLGNASIGLQTQWAEPGRGLVGRRRFCPLPAQQGESQTKTTARLRDLHTDGSRDVRYCLASRSGTTDASLVPSRSRLYATPCTIGLPAMETGAHGKSTQMMGPKTGSIAFRSGSDSIPSQLMRWASLSNFPISPQSA